MVMTAFKSNQDVFHTPPRWLPYDNVRVEVNGEELPLYNVKTPDGTQATGGRQNRGRRWHFIDPPTQARTREYEIQQGSDALLNRSCTSVSAGRISPTR